MRRKIDEKTVEHVARVAMLKLTDQEIKKFTKQLNDVLEAFKVIDQVDTSKIEPSFHPQKIVNVWREDKSRKYEWDPLSNTPLKEKGYFKGPRIV